MLRLSLSLLKCVTIFIYLAKFAFAKDANVLMTEVFQIVVDPPLFNWTYEGRRDQFVYEASLLNAPDLPSWIHYVYSERHHSGYLYGVPPNKNKAVVPLEVVALNKHNYETRVKNINVIISEKLNPAKYELHLKIDNLNVEDMFEVDRMDALKDIFRKQLWRDSDEDLYVTFLESAIEMGARKPLNPSEGEGVIVRFGSEVVFSSELLELQEEVRPLYKVSPCPRGFKKTSVERYFKEAGFSMDWCSFRLIRRDENNNSAMHKSNHVNTEEDAYDDYWRPISRDELPKRSYMKELLLTITVPTFVMVILVLILTFVLCFHHDDLIGLSEETVESVTPHQPASQFSTFNSADTFHNYLNSKEAHSCADAAINCGVHCRPSPPPYVRPKFKPEL
ncbi:epsilon-sarcoglycan isoform X2 [Cylas formicarius]|uniref:epsilon-sarcoglycan isoform X2 n=1 Tax=Cylas formicarius TaxID=197179 RepID=UPI002958BC48|nr:epsilon-sarcoglycan isoform X2 [Cylas formicarius]